MDPKLEFEIQRGWCLLLLDEYRRLQTELPALARVPPPNIVIEPRLQTTWGQWDAAGRRVILAARLVADSDFATVMRVFKHELAHLVVAEVYGLPDADAHGEAFARACGLLQIPAEARVDLEIQTGRRHQLLERVQKLLALGTSQNQHEAEQALAKARELALKYNLEAVNDTRDDYGLRPLGPVGKRLPAHLWSILSIVSDFYFARYICRSCADPQGGTYRVIELYGHPDNLETAEYVYYFLLHQGEQEWRCYRRQQRLRNNRMKASFLNGLYAGFRSKLEGETRRLAQEKALVWLGDPGLDAFYRRRNPHVRTRNVPSRIQADVHAAGVEVGKDLQFKPGLRPSDARGAGRRLLE